MEFSREPSVRNGQNLPDIGEKTLALRLLFRPATPVSGQRESDTKQR
jgi:hypothetical protein